HRQWGRKRLGRREFYCSGLCSLGRSLRFAGTARGAVPTWGLESSQARCWPPFEFRAETTLADHFATSSSRRVLSADWNLARSSTEYLPDGIEAPRNISRGRNSRSSGMAVLSTAPC